MAHPINSTSAHVHDDTYILPNVIVEVNNGNQKEDQMLIPVTPHFCLCQSMLVQLIINYSYIDRGIRCYIFLALD